MKYAVLTVKHTDGYCLWDSKHTTHDIASFKNFKEGKGDIVREFVDACRKHHLKPAKDLVAMLELCNRRRANYLLNVGPDKTGRLPDPTVEKLREIGKLWGIHP